MTMAQPRGTSNNESRDGKQKACSDKCAKMGHDEPPCHSACECPLCEESSGTERGVKDPKEVLRREGILSGAMLQWLRSPEYW